VRFGSKSFAPQLGSLMLVQTTALVVMATLGPASVALFARSQALIRNASHVVNRYAVVILPTASALYAMGRRDELQRELIESTRTGLFLALPFFLLFSILGRQLLTAWMGPNYEQSALLTLLSCGYLFTMAMQPSMSVLSGMNAHGRAGFARMLGAATATVGVIVALGVFEGSLTWVGVAIAAPLVVVNGIYLPIYACGRLDVPLLRFVREATGRPVLCTLPLALSFGAARYRFAEDPWWALVTGLAAAALLSGPLYWRYAMRGLASTAFGDRSNRLADSAAPSHSSTSESGDSPR